MEQFNNKKIYFYFSPHCWVSKWVKTWYTILYLVIEMCNESDTNPDHFTSKVHAMNCENSNETVKIVVLMVPKGDR